MKTHNVYIPTVNLIEEGESSFLIRPILAFIDPVSLQEKPHRHNYQEIIYIQSGTGNHVIDDKDITLKPNTFYCINKGQVHNFISGQNLKGFLIRFGNHFLPSNSLASKFAFYSNLSAAAAELNVVSLKKKEAATFTTLLKQLHTEYQKPQKTFGKKTIVQHLLLVLLIELQRKNIEAIETTSHFNPSTDKNRFYNFLDVLEENFYKEHQLSFYAEHLGIDGRKLSDIVRNYTGKPAKKVLLERLIVEAKRLLKHTSKNQKEITYDLGFETVPYFSRVFKKQTGLTPKNFRLSAMEKV